MLWALSIVLLVASAWGLHEGLKRKRASKVTGQSAQAHANQPAKASPTAAAPTIEPPAEPPIVLPPAGPNGGLLDIDAPVPMTVWLGDQYLGTTPLKALPLPSGTMLLKLENRRDGGTVMRTVSLRPKKHQRLVVSEARGVLDVTAEPWAWLQMGLHPAQETPAHLELYEGDYELTTECPNGLRRQETVRVGAQWPTRLVVRCDGPQ